MREVPALGRGLRILDLLASTSTPLRIADIAARLQLPRSATYELVSTLKEYRAVTVSETGGVALGSMVLMLGAAFEGTIDLAQLATQAARELSAKSEETSQVGILDGRDVLYIAKAEPSRQLRLVSAVGRRIPAHCTGLGKALLAYLTPESLDALVGTVQLERLTPNSISTRRDLLRELERIRAVGYAFDEGESNLDVCCVAAPVRDHTGNVAAGISVSVPESRMTESTRDELVHLVLAQATEFSGLLGHRSRSSEPGSTDDLDGLSAS